MLSSCFFLVVDVRFTVKGYSCFLKVLALLSVLYLLLGHILVHMKIGEYFHINICLYFNTVLRAGSSVVGNVVN